MDVILIPGLWLDGDSWEQVTPALVRAGHTVHPLTLPGLESVDAERDGITFADHVAATVAVIDSIEGEVALVGHSGGGAIASVAADARPDRVAQVVYVDSGPASEGGVINDELPEVDGEIPLPDWGAFEENDLRDMDDTILAAFRDRAIPSPLRVATDAAHLTDERRYDVPSTVIATSMPGAMFEELIAKGHPWVAELGRMKHRRIVDLPTGHWPQFTRPTELGAVIVDALADRP